MQLEKIKYRIKIRVLFILYVMIHFSQFRYLKEWIVYYLNRKKINPIDHGIPWLNFPTIQYLDQVLNDKMKVFEWGSGGSTIFLSKRVHSLTSIEYDTEFYQHIKSKLAHFSINNVDMRYVSPQLSGKIGSEHPTFKDKYFDAYVDIISQYPDNYFDAIFVDGRARIECLKKAIPKLKSDGIIVFDNIERPRYYSSIYLLNDWNKKKFEGIVPFSFLINKTLIAQRITT